MDYSFGWVNWSIFGFYLIGIFVLGSLFSKRQTSTDEFFRASKRFGWLIISLSLLASVHSGVGFISHPARVYRNDAMVMITWLIGSSLCIPLVAYLMVPFYRKLDVTTAYEYLEKRFGLSVRLLTSALFIMQRLIWMSLVCLAPSLILSVVIGLRVEYSIIIIGLLATLYTALGGMSAVIWTDAVQFVVLTVGKVLIVIVVAMKLSGGFMEILQVTVADSKIMGSMAWDISRPTFWTVLLSACFMGLSWGVDQVNVQRIMSAKSEKAAKRSLLSLIGIQWVHTPLLILVGLSFYAFYKAFPGLLTDEVRQSTDMLLPYFTVSQIPVGIAGVVIAAIFAAAMSSYDSGLNCITAAITLDWYKRVVKKEQSDVKYLFFARVLTVVLGIAIMLLAIVIYKTGVKSIIDFSNKYLGFFFGPIIGLFVLGLFTRRAKSLPAVIGAIISVLVVLVIDLINLNQLSQPDGQRIIDIYLYGPITITTTVVLGYLGSLFGPELPIEKVREYTLIKK